MKMIMGILITLLITLMVVSFVLKIKIAEAHRSEMVSIQLDIEEIKTRMGYLANKELALEREIQAFFKMLPRDNQIALYEYLKTEK